MTLRIGLIGAGWVTKYHLDAYRDLAGKGEVVAIADPNEEACRGRAGEYAIAAAYADATAMLSRERLDAVDIASPRECHAEHVRLAAAHGLPAICQKPLAPSFGEAQALVAEIAGRVPLMVHENWRFRPHYRRIASWLRAGEIGKPIESIMRLFTSGLLRDGQGRCPALLRQPMLASLERMLVMEIAIHHIDTLRFLLGPLTLRQAQMGRNSADVRGEDWTRLMLSSAEGTVLLDADFNAPGYPPDLQDHLEIRGETGRIVLRGARLELDAIRRESLTLDLPANYAASYRNTIEHFLDGLAGGGFAENSAQDNLETLRLVDEAYAMGAYAA